MHVQLQRKLGLTILTGFAVSAVILLGFALNGWFPFSSKAGFINYGSGTVLGCYLLYEAWRIFRNKVPFWFKSLAAERTRPFVIVATTLMGFTIVNLLYLAYYPPFQNKIDLPMMRALTPFLMFSIIATLVLSALSALIHIHQRNIRATDYIGLVVEWTAFFIFLEQVFNIAVAYFVW